LCKEDFPGELLAKFNFAAAFSTRFSTELLKTFTKYSSFLSGLLFEWFQKCVAARIYFS